MAKAEFELGVYESGFCPESIKRQAREAIDLLPEGPTFYTPISSHLDRDYIPKRALVAGGEGSIGRVLQMLHDEEAIKSVVGVLPGGSQNVLYNDLRKLGLHSDIRTFLEKTLDNYPENKRLRPGIISDGVNERVFVNHVGLGRVEQHLGRFNARLRFLPNGYRTLAATLLALAAASPHPGKDFLNLYTITPRIGPIRFFPHQELLSNTITHAWGNIRHIGQLQASCFQDTTAGNHVWFDGDTRLYSQEEIKIKRAPYGIPVVAIT